MSRPYSNDTDALWHFRYLYKKHLSGFLTAYTAAQKAKYLRELADEIEKGEVQ